MRLILEIANGHEQGRRIWLGRHQYVDVGRTEHAAFVCCHDQKLADVHFRIQYDDQGARLQTLDERFVTWVNGVSVGHAALRSGDRVLAGETMFSVRIEEDANGVEEAVPPVSVATPRVESTTSQEPLYRVGYWSFYQADPRWELLPEQGIQRKLERESPFLILVDQGELPEGVTIDDFVEAQSAQAQSAEMEYLGGKSWSIRGADSAHQSACRKQLPNGKCLIQLQLTAVRQDMVGLATILGPEQALDTLQAELDQIVQAMAFETKSNEADAAAA